MPKTSTLRVPSYRRHKPTGHAVVTINGQDIYLVRWNTAASRAEYERLIAEFLANGRRLQSDADGTVVEVLNGYRKFAENYYRKDGRVANEYGGIKDALKLVREHLPIRTRIVPRAASKSFGMSARASLHDRPALQSTTIRALFRIRLALGCCTSAVERAPPGAPRPAEGPSPVGRVRPVGRRTSSIQPAAPARTGVASDRLLKLDQVLHAANVFELAAANQVLAERDKIARWFAVAHQLGHHPENPNVGVCVKV